MAKKKETKPETKSDFLRRVLTKNPNLDHEKVNHRWVKEGHPGEISNALYYLVRRELGIKTEWVWVQEEKPVSASASGEVYQFKITLLDSTPPIWRRIQVADETLDQFHEQIQAAMGWSDSHLHHYRIEGKLYADPMLMQESFEELEYSDSTKVRLSEILPKRGGRYRFEYEYDFGDSWLHEIQFEGRVPVEAGKKYPICLDGARACPPEDVGGVWGYQDLLEAISDPRHEAHQEMREWVGRKFDPEAFSPVGATRRMKRGLPNWRPW